MVANQWIVSWNITDTAISSTLHPSCVRTLSPVGLAMDLPLSRQVYVESHLEWVKEGSSYYGPCQRVEFILIIPAQVEMDPKSSIRAFQTVQSPVVSQSVVQQMSIMRVPLNGNWCVLDCAVTQVDCYNELHLVQLDRTGNEGIIGHLGTTPRKHLNGPWRLRCDAAENSAFLNCETFLEAGASHVPLSQLSMAQLSQWLALKSRSSVEAISWCYNVDCSQFWMLISMTELCKLVTQPMSDSQVFDPIHNQCLERNSSHRQHQGRQVRYWRHYSYSTPCQHFSCHFPQPRVVCLHGTLLDGQCLCHPGWGTPYEDNQQPESTVPIMCHVKIQEETSLPVTRQKHHVGLHPYHSLGIVFPRDVSLAEPFHGVLLLLCGHHASPGVLDGCLHLPRPILDFQRRWPFFCLSDISVL